VKKSRRHILHRGISSESTFDATFLRAAQEFESIRPESNMPKAWR